MPACRFIGNGENDTVHLPVFEQFDRFVKRHDGQTGVVETAV